MVYPRTSAQRTFLSTAESLRIKRNWFENERKFLINFPDERYKYKKKLIYENAVNINACILVFGNRKITRVSIVAVFGAHTLVLYCT